MRRREKSWMDFDELTKPFLAPDSPESATTVAVELHDRMVKVEQQVLAQYTATAAYATLAQQGAEQVRAEARADLDRVQSTALGLIDKLRVEVNNRLEGIEARPDVRAASFMSDSSGKVAALEERMKGMVTALDALTKWTRILAEYAQQSLGRG